GEGPFLRTGDLGFVLDGECYVTGRLKDIVIIRGTNHYPHDIELTVQRSHPALRPDCGAAFSVDVGDEERLVVVQEIRRTYLKKANTDEILTALRRALFEEHELAAHAIVLVRTASILKTSSGKIQRRACRDLFLDDGFPTIASWRLDSAAGASTSSPGAMPAVTAPNIQDWIVKWIAARLERDPLHIRPHDPFDAFGMDSLSAVDLVHDLSGWTGKAIDETTLWNYPTIWDLAQFVARDDDAAAPPPQVRDEEISARQQDDNLDQLSEEELVGLLYEEIQTDEPGG
ncbi:MAG TPA: AMP-dependent synthetase, partial [Candidatus Latescibacteria bacterium]|nr:AMP-dependent synthetase [Candidatus Latescibacterota bacterium]